MSFMHPQVYEDDFFEIDTTDGTEIVPGDVIGRTCATHVEALLNYLEGSPLDPDEEIPVKRGWLARMTAPGYMDCTPWTAHETQFDALVHLVDTYMEDTHCVLAVPSHYLSALVNGDESGLEPEDVEELEAFIAANPEANGIESVSEDHHFDGYQDVTPCICRLPKEARHV